MTGSINDSQTPVDGVHKTRAGEKDKFWFRGNRFFTLGVEWFFTTRENRDVGPYKDKGDAEKGLELYLECVVDQELDVEHAISVAQQGKWAVASFR